MGIAPWGALGGGKFKTEAQRRAGEGRQISFSESDIRVSAALEKIAKAKGTVITSIAMAYVMQKTPNVFPIVGGRKVDHLKGNIEALSIELSDADIEAIESAVPFDMGFPHTMLWAGSPGMPKQSKVMWALAMGGINDYVEEPKASLASMSA